MDLQTTKTLNVVRLAPRPFENGDEDTKLFVNLKFQKLNARLLCNVIITGTVTMGWHMSRYSEDDDIYIL